MTRPVFAQGTGTSPAGPPGPASTVPGPAGPVGGPGPQGLPGVNAVANDTATASYIASPTSATATALSASYVPTLGLSTGTDDAALLNARLLAAKTAGGGVVKGTPGQTYVFANPVVLQSGVTLDLSGCTWKRAAGYFGLLFTNAALTPLRTVSTAVTTASTTLNATGAAFTSADVGRAINVAGAGLNGAYGPSDLYATIVAVNSATQAVMSVAAVTAVSSASLSIFGRDKNIGIICDRATVIDAGNFGAGVGTSEVYMNKLRRIDGLRISGNGATCKTGTGGGGVVFWSTGDCADMVLEGFTWAVTCAGVQPCGPMVNYTIRDHTGVVGDDMVALQGSGYGYPNVNDVQGDHRSGRVRDIYAKPTIGVAVKAFGGLTNAGVQTDFSDIVIERISGVGNGFPGVLLQSERSGVLNIGTTTVRDVQWSGGRIAEGPVVIQTVGARDITVENIGHDGSSGTSGAPKVVLSLNQCAVQTLNVRGLALGKVESYVHLIGMQSGSVVTLNATDLNLHYNANCKALNVDAASTISGSLKMGRVNALTNGRFIDAAGAINELHLSQATFQAGPGGGPERVISLTKAGSTTVVRLTDVNFVNYAAALWLSSVSAVVTLNGVNFGAGNPVAIHADTAGTLRVIAAATQWAANNAFGLNIPLSVDGDVRLDLQALGDFLAPQDGDTAYNVNAALSCGVGRVVRSAAASKWKNLYSGAVYPA